jgi:RimJ/RimL family protein N-acetyltransferase
VNCDLNPKTGMHSHGRDPSPASTTTLESSLRRLSLAAKLARMRSEIAHPLEVSMSSVDAQRRDQKIELRTARLVLRPLIASDLPAFLRMLQRSREHLNAFCPLHAPGAAGDDDHATFLRQLELARGALSTRRALRLNAFLPDGTLVGGFNLNDIQRGLENMAELVAWVGIDHVGQGYATEGVSRLLEYGFGDAPRGVGLQKVIGLVAPENGACIRLLRKCGFRSDPNAGQLELTIDRRRVAHDVYSIFAPVSLETTAQVEGKPSIPQRILGTGLLSILKTEAQRAPGYSEP